MCVSRWGDKCRQVSRHEKHHEQVYFHLAFCQLRYMMTSRGTTALDAKLMQQILRYGAPTYVLHTATHDEAQASLLVSVWCGFHTPSAHNMWIADVFAHICTLTLGCGQAHWRHIAILRQQKSTAPCANKTWVSKLHYYTPRYYYPEILSSQEISIKDTSCNTMIYKHILTLGTTKHILW